MTSGTCSKTDARRPASGGGARSVPRHSLRWVALVWCAATLSLGMAADDDPGTLPQGSGAAPPGSGEVPGWLVELTREISAAAPDRVHFVERRLYPFKGRERTFEGVIDLSVADAVIFHYRKPERVTIAFQEEVVRIDREGRRARTFPAKSRSGPLLRAALAMDWDALRDIASLSIQGDRREWEIEVVPYDAGDVVLLRLSGWGTEVRELLLDMAGGSERRFAFSREDLEMESPADSESARSQP